MSLSAPTAAPSATPNTTLDALVLYEDDMRRTRFACGCTIDDHATFREANLCPRHHTLATNADLVRYWSAASVILLTLVCACA